MSRLSALACVVAVLFALQSATLWAGSAREIGWDDLMGRGEPYDDPFLPLSPSQLSDLSVVARIRERQAGDRNVPESVLAELDEKEKGLRDQGIDVDYLLSQREIIKAKRIAASEATNNSLDHQYIRMPGFLLPLQFDGDLVTEFLLVPFVGACIHVPPPPPNQIVSVAYPAGYKNGGMFAPIWVEGTMRVGKAEKDLFLADGSADIPVGYSLLADSIAPYESPR